MIFIVRKKDAALFVEGLLKKYDKTYQSITITKLKKYAGCSVNIVTDISSEDTVRKWGLRYLKGLPNTSWRITQD